MSFFISPAMAEAGAAGAAGPFGDLSGLISEEAADAKNAPPEAASTASGFGRSG